MATRWSFNIDGLDVDPQVWDLLIADAKINSPTYVTIMDDKGKAKQWRQTIPSTQVIYRTYDIADNYYHHTIAPQQAAARLEADHHDLRDVWHYYRLNEPGGEWNRYQDWIIRFAQEAKVRGFKVTAGGLALSKNWHTPDEIRNGLADALLDYAIANENTFLVDAHEYVTGTLWSPQIPNYPGALFDRDRILANEHIPVVVDSYTGYQNAINWGLFRVCWLTNARSLERHGKPLKCVINEGLNDFNAHIIQEPHTYSILPNGQRVKTEDEIRKYGEDKYLRDVRGVLGHWLYLSWVFTGKMEKVSESAYCDILMRNFQWAEKSYPENVKGIMLFAINKDWELPEGHDFHPVIRTLLPKMKALATVTPTPQPQPVPLPPPTRTLRPIRMQGRENTINLRDKPSITANKVGELPAAPTITSGYVETGDGAFIAPYLWKWYEFKDATGKDLKGYMASDLIAEVFGEPPASQPDYKALAIEILEKAQETLDSDIAQKIAQKMEIDRQLAELRNTA